jgi:hypothetical protein
MDTPATKEDLKKLASKTDLKRVETDLKRVERSLRGEILRVEERGETIEDGQKRIEVKVDRVLNTLDAFVGRLETVGTANEVGTHQMCELDKRVTKLETSSKSPS